MSLLDRIPSRSGLPLKTLADLAAAADERLEDARQLAECVPPRATAAVYMCGYAVEMMLKYALYRAMGAGANEDVSLGASGLRSTRRRAEDKVKQSGGANFHDLIFIWSALEQLSASSDPILSAHLKFRVREMALEWREWLRYRPESATRSEMERALKIATEIRIHRDRIAR